MKTKTKDCKNLIYIGLGVLPFIILVGLLIIPAVNKKQANSIIKNEAYDNLATNKDEVTYITSDTEPDEIVDDTIKDDGKIRNIEGVEIEYVEDDTTLYDFVHQSDDVYSLNIYVTSELCNIPVSYASEIYTNNYNINNDVEIIAGGRNNDKIVLVDEEENVYIITYINDEYGMPAIDNIEKKTLSDYK